MPRITAASDKDAPRPFTTKTDRRFRVARNLVAARVGHAGRHAVVEAHDPLENRDIRARGAACEQGAQRRGVGEEAV